MKTPFAGGATRTATACGFALMLLCVSSSVGYASTLTYSLNGTLAEDSGNGPALVAYGGALSATGFDFSGNEGLSLSGVGTSLEYSIDIKFYFDNVNASANGYQRILDFKNRITDQGLYSLNGALTFFSPGFGYPTFTSAGAFTNGTLSDLLLTRSSTGQFSAHINGGLAFSFLDTTLATTLSGPNSVLFFFMDDFQSQANYPNLPEVGTGFIDSITITTPSPVPIGSSLVSQLIGLALLGLTGWRRKWLSGHCIRSIQQDDIAETFEKARSHSRQHGGTTCPDAGRSFC